MGMDGGREGGRGRAAVGLGLGLGGEDGSFLGSPKVGMS